MYYKINRMLNTTFAFLALAFMASLGVGGAMYNISRIWWKNDIIGHGIQFSEIDLDIATGRFTNGLGVFISALLVVFVVVTVVLFYCKRTKFTGFLLLDLCLAILILHNMWLSEYWFSDSNTEVTIKMKFWTNWSHWLYFLAAILAFSNGLHLTLNKYSSANDSVAKNSYKSFRIFFIAGIATIPFIYHTIKHDEYIFISQTFKPINYLGISVLAAIILFSLTSFFFKIDFSSSDQYLDYYYRIMDHRKTERINQNIKARTANASNANDNSIKVKVNFSNTSYKDVFKNLDKVKANIQHQIDYNEKQKAQSAKSKPEEKKEATSKKINFADFSDFDI